MISDSLGGSLALLGDGGGTASRSRSRSRSRSGRFREMTKGSRGDLSHDGNESDRELHLDDIGR